ncbi:MAG: NHLP bacteriocin export ABC transporter permease/ATPase subunit [Mobilitalea sp.]
MENRQTEKYILKNVNSQKEYVVENREHIWLVRKGTVLLYLTQVNEENIPQRRYFISEFKAGEVFLARNSDMEGLQFKPLVTAETEAEILGIEIPEFLSKETSNLKEYRLLLNGMIDFFMKLESLHHLNISLPEDNAVTVDGILSLTKTFFDALTVNVTQTKKEEQEEINKRRALFEKSRKNSLKSIGQFLSGRSKSTPVEEAQSGNPEYDACKLICKTMGIRIAKYQIIQSCLQGAIDLEGISRVSKFPVREIVLEGEWWRKDIGCVLAYDAKDNRPIALIQKSPGKFTAYDTQDNVSFSVDRQYAEKLLLKAYMIYKPFPSKALDKKDILSFIFSTLNKRDFVFLAGLTLFTTIIGLIIPLFEQVLFDNYLPEGDKTGIIQIGFLFISIALGGFLIEICEDLMNYRLGIKIKYCIESAVYDRLFNLPSTFFNGYNSGDLAKRVISVTGMLESFSSIIISSIVSGVFSLIYFIQMVSYSFKLAAVGIILIALKIGVKLINRKLLLHNAKNFNTSANKVFDFTNQLLTNIKKIRISRVTDLFLNKWTGIFITFKKVNVVKMSISNYVNNIIMFLSVFSTIIFYFLIMQPGIDIKFGKFIAFTTLFGMFSASILSLADAYIAYISMLPSFAQISPILKTPPEDYADNIPPASLTGHIEISNISFKYSNDSPFVLKDVSFQIQQGEYVGIVGASGSGKSTLLRLLLGFEKPTVGKIFYDDMDIAKVDKRELRKKLGVVLQDGKLISGSIYENITLSNRRITAEQVKDTVRLVGIENDIERMPMGLHTVVSENSTTISGGQKQRILIARAIVNNPSVLFLDEATSALDNMTQSVVTQNLDNLHVTRIVIAHRLSTIINCDRIVVLEKGTIVETGSYEELMSKKGLFYSMAGRQIA